MRSFTRFRAIKAKNELYDVIGILASEIRASHVDSRQNQWHIRQNRDRASTRGKLLLKVGGRECVYTYFVRCHRRWRDIRLFGTEPSRYTGLLSQSFRRVSDKPVK